MKRWSIGALCIGFFLVGHGLLGCGEGAKNPTDGPAQEEEVSVFADAQLEQAVRQALEKPEAILRQTDLVSLTKLEAQSRQIKTLTGIGQLSNLTVLDLSENQIQDLKPLSILPHLAFLALTANQIEDLSPLLALPRLQSLLIEGNRVQDITPLMALTQLEYLALSGNPLNEASLNSHLSALKTSGVEVAFEDLANQVDQALPGESHFWIYYIGRDQATGRSNIYVLATDGRDPINLTNNDTRATFNHLTASPDGSQVAFVSDWDFGYGYHIYALSFGSTEPVKLTKVSGIGTTYGDLAWSPDGMRIAFARYFFSGPFFEIMTLDINTGGETVDQTQSATGQVFNTMPKWSPDGTRLAFSQGRGNPLAGPDLFREDIFVVNVDQGNTVNLTDHPRPDRFPLTSQIWSPDGTQLLFFRLISTGPTVDIDIFTTPVDGSGPLNITNDPSFDWDPAWSPQGGSIVYTRDGFIHTMGEDGSNKVNLGIAGGGPTWSPDGARIAYVNQGDLFIVNADGTFPANLTPADLLPGDSSSSFMAWGPQIKEEQ